MLCFGKPRMLRERVSGPVAALVAENARLRQQRSVLPRPGTSPAFTPRDRVALVLLARLGRGWRAALLIVQPDTLLRWLRWLRHGDRLVWRVRSATALTRPPVSAATVALIKRMAEEHRLWGAEHLRGDLLTRGVRVGTRTVQRHRRGGRPTRPTRPHGQTWATFLHNHAAAVWACDVLPRSDVGFRALVAFFSVDLGARRVVHIGVTRHPTDTWVAPQWREATPFGMSPRFVIRDNDATFGAQCARVAARSRIEVVRTPVRAPRANALYARFLGSVRRAGLDHLLILHERQLLHVLRAYGASVKAARPHQGIAQSIPAEGKTARMAPSRVPSVPIPVLGGLHHDDRRAA